MQAAAPDASGRMTAKARVSGRRDVAAPGKLLDRPYGLPTPHRSATPSGPQSPCRLWTPPRILGGAKVGPCTLTPPRGPWRDHAAASVEGGGLARLPLGATIPSQAERILPTQAQRRVGGAFANSYASDSGLLTAGFEARAAR